MSKARRKNPIPVTSQPRDLNNQATGALRLSDSMNVMVNYGDALDEVSFLPVPRHARQFLFRVHNDLESQLGGIQASIAQESVWIRGHSHLAVCRAAMGNMICIHNIVVACAVLALANVESAILKEPFPPVILYGITLAAAAALLF